MSAGKSGRWKQLPAVLLILTVGLSGSALAGEEAQDVAFTESEISAQADPEYEFVQEDQAQSPEIQEHEAEAETEAPAEPSASAKEQSGADDLGGLIEDPQGNASVEGIEFEITDSWAKEDMEREREAAEAAGLYTYGKLYPPAPLLDGINSFRQGDLRWGLHSYGYADAACTVPATLSSSGCGILSLVNAVYHMTGQFIEPAGLADWACAHGFRMNGVGTVHSMYRAYAVAFGDTYGFAYAGSASSLPQIRSFLQEGGAAIISTPHHLMAVADYDPEKGGYLLLDSAPSAYRGTYPTGYRYLSDEDFAQSIPVYSIMLLEKTRDTSEGMEDLAHAGAILPPENMPDGEDLFAYIKECYLRDQLILLEEGNQKN